mmetsp:Transcript_30542/g.61560  ORF Transcript_30542/g.61560 Transcript_30542/m.61560 type:complete len:241 (-) Transcript_30542:50-772(-)
MQKHNHQPDAHVACRKGEGEEGRRDHVMRRHLHKVLARLPPQPLDQQEYEAGEVVRGLHRIQKLEVCRYGVRLQVRDLLHPPVEHHALPPPRPEPVGVPRHLGDGAQRTRVVKQLHKRVSERLCFLWKVAPTEHVLAERTEAAEMHSNGHAQRANEEQTDHHGGGRDNSVEEELIEIFFGADGLRCGGVEGRARPHEHHGSVSGELPHLQACKHVVVWELVRRRKDWFGRHADGVHVRCF